MRGHRVYGLLAAVWLMTAGGNAFAGTVNIDCAANSGALAAQFANGGTANTTYNVTGPCSGSFAITQSNINIQGQPTNQAINGTIFVEGAFNIGLNNLTITGDPLGSEVVSVSGPASVTIGSSTIQDGVICGVCVDGPALVTVSGKLQYNGFRGQLQASHGAVIEAGNVTITGSPTAVSAAQGSTVEVTFGDISGAVVAQGSSSVRLVDTRVTGPNDGYTVPVLVSLGSSAYLDSSNITADAPFDANNQFGVITVEDSSSVLLGGFSPATITNNATGGVAVMLSGGSTLKNAAVVGNNYTITGDGRIHTQSVIELGVAGSPGNPFQGALTWDGNIFLSQASSFRADGANVTINGTLTLDQASNGYFNHFAATSNVISSVVCKSATDHVSNPNLVTPPVTIGPPPGCALF